MDGLYDKDFIAWTRQQAELLRSTRPNALDWERLAEEIEDLGKRERRELQQNLARIMEHLLKLEYSPAEPPRRQWALTVQEHRRRVRHSLDESGTLRAELAGLLDQAWSDALEAAGDALRLMDGVDPSVLPSTRPYAFEQLLDRDWLPAGADEEQS